MKDAQEWAESAMLKRPWRTEFFDAFVSAIGSASTTACRVLELGSGPGFLAEHLLNAFPEISYVALDFSGAMHQLADKRIGQHADRVQFIERSFRDSTWWEGLGQFDFVVTQQAVHELRHKRYADALHTQVRHVLMHKGSYLVCDHFVGDGGMANDQLYMSVAEQKESLHRGGFMEVKQLLLKGGLVLHQAN